MSDAKELLPRNFRIDQLVKSATLFVGIGTACLLPMAANAQMATPTATSAAYMSNSTDNSSVTSADSAGQQPAIDYTILSNPTFSYAEIIRAKAYGLSDAEIGRAMAIADKARVPSSEVLDKIKDGWTFATLADYYDIPAGWRDAVSPDEINAYITAYRTTGRGALRADTSATWASSSAPMSFSMSSSSSATDIIHTLRSSGNFRTFVKALHRTGLDATLESAGPYTVFAPTDDAFAALPKDQLKALWKNKDELTQVINYHIIPARITATDALSMTSPSSTATLEGDSLQVTSSKGQVMINGQLVTTPDIQASNGVIHAVDGVLIPSSVQQMMNSGTTPMTTTSTINQPMPGTATAPGADSKTPTPNAVNGTAPNSTMLPGNAGNTDNSGNATGTSTTPNATTPGLNPGVVTPGTPTPPVNGNADNNMPTPQPVAPQTTPVTPAPNATTPDNTVPNVNVVPGTVGGPATTPQAVTPATPSPDTGTTTPATTPNTTVPDNGAAAPNAGTDMTTPSTTPSTGTDTTTPSTTPSTGTDTTTPSTTPSTTVPDNGAATPSTGTNMSAPATTTPQ